LDVNEEDWKDLGRNGQKIFKSIRAIRFMNVTQCHVLFLSVLRNYEKLGTDSTRIFQLIEKFSFLYFAISNLPGNKMEKIYSRCARKIEEIINQEPDKKIPGLIQATFEELKKELMEEKPSFEVFNDSFFDIEYGKSEKSRMLIKYIFNEINNHFETGEQVIDFTNVNIEHILPQKPSKEWNLKRKEIKSYVDKLGNLTLIHKKFNSSGGNKTIKEKITDLQKSNLHITNKLVDELKNLNYIWNQQEIDKRHKVLSELAYKNVWTF
jgi:hypothetical protein